MNENREKKLKSLVLRFLNIDIIQELTFAGIGCLSFLYLYRIFPNDFWDPKARNTFCALLILSFFIVYLIFNQPNSKNKIFKVNYKRNIIIFTIFNFAILSFLFYETKLGYNGISNDNWYRIAFITKIVNSGYPQDFTFKGYSAFMAPLYWYFLALIAIIFRIEPYKMIKLGFLFSYYLFPILLYESWKKIFDKKLSLIITIIFFTFITNYHEINWIDHMIGYMFLIPYFLYYFENINNLKFSKKNMIFAGFIGSILVCTFYLYFIVVPIYYVINFFQNREEFFDKKFKRIMIIGISIILFSSWFWFPLTLDILKYGVESHQNLFYPIDAWSVPFEMYFQFDLKALILFMGIVFILLRYRYSQELKIFGNIVLTTYLLYIIGYIGYLAGFPIMHYRILTVSHYVIYISFVVFYVKFFEFFTEKEIYNIKISKLNLNFKILQTYLLISIIFYQNYVNTVSLYKSKYYYRARTQKVDEDLIEIFEELDYEDKVFLTQHTRIAMYLPIYLFICHNAHYSHPSALNNERVEFLVELSECDSSKEFYDKIMDGQFGPIDYFFLEPSNENATKFYFDKMEYEKLPDREKVKVTFNAELFENDKYFKKIIIKGKIIYKTRY